MTDNELIKTHIEECEERIGRILGYMETAEDANTKFCERNVEVLKSVVIALEEIQQYRELGTVELLIKSNAKALFEHVELEQYRAIGTVEGYDRAIKTSKENYLLYAEYKSKVKEFESIGTIEEIKEKLSLLEKYEELGTVEELDEVLNMIC